MKYLIVIAITGGLILIHEFGHLLMALWMKIPVTRFSIGFGPKMWMFKKKDTEYWLSIIPIGGYVLPNIKDEAELFKIPVHKRIIFALGGPSTNTLLALFLFAFLNTITSGFSFAGIATEPFSQTWRQACQILGAIPRLFSHPDELSGVVGIVAQGGGFVGTNPIKAASFAILLSLNLAIFNLLPIAPLDGGKIILYLLEKVHPKLSRLHVPLAVAGWVLLIGLMVYATALDVGRHVVGAFA